MLKLIQDINLAAYLLAIGFKQAKPPQIQQGQICFVFDDSKGEISAAIPKFFNKNAPADALTFSEYLRVLKAQLLILKRNARAGGGQDD